MFKWKTRDHLRLNGFKIDNSTFKILSRNGFSIANWKNWKRFWVRLIISAPLVFKGCCKKKYFISQCRTLRSTYVEQNKKEKVQFECFCLKAVQFFDKNIICQSISTVFFKVCLKFCHYFCNKVLVVFKKLWYNTEKLIFLLKGN